MGATTKTTILIQKTLLDQAETLAQQLNISQNQLIESALENFIKSSQSQVLLDKDEPDQNGQMKSDDRDGKPATQMDGRSRRINQGDVYWVQLEEPSGSDLGYAHPHVVIQDDIITHSRINTVVVCGLTSNRKRASEPGNILLEVGEANLSRQSVLVVSQIFTVDKGQLGEYIGSLTKRRINQILVGMRFQQVSYFARYN